VVKRNEKRWNGRSDGREKIRMAPLRLFEQFHVLENR